MKIEQINGFSIGNVVRLKDGDGRPHTIRSFTLDGIRITNWFCVVHFEDGTETMLDNIEIFQQPSLPEGLDEAANNYGIDVRLGYPRVMDETDRYIYNAFKAGAEWMAGQGVFEDGKVISVYGRKVIEHKTDIGVQESVIPGIEDFNVGDKVIVQIRKK